jgi:hypothetical protein
MVDGWTKVSTVADVVIAVATVCAVLTAVWIALRQDKLSKRVVRLEEERSDREREQHSRASFPALAIQAVGEPSGTADGRGIDYTFPVQVVNAGGVGAAGIMVRMMGGDDVLAAVGPAMIPAGQTVTLQIPARTDRIKAKTIGIQYVGEGDLALELLDGDGALIQRWGMQAASDSG